MVVEQPPGTSSSVRSRLTRNSSGTTASRLRRTIPASRRARSPGSKSRRERSEPKENAQVTGRLGMREVRCSRRKAVVRRRARATPTATTANLAHHRPGPIAGGSWASEATNPFRTQASPRSGAAGGGDRHNYALCVSDCRHAANAGESAVAAGWWSRPGRSAALTALSFAGYLRTDSTRRRAP